ncbi:MAG: ABC transporter substrate-binding protein [Pseudomonadota bacterium]
MIKNFSCALFLICIAYSPSIIAAERIVSIGGSITEILYEFDLQDNIIAVDTTSQYPEGTQDKPNVGYMRTLAAEPIIAMNPDLILYLEGAGPPETIEQLEQTGINMVMVSNEHSIDGVKSKISEVAEAVGMQDKGEALSASLDTQYQQLNEYLNGVDESARVIFILSFDQSSAMVAGKDTGADSIIRIAKGENVADDFKSYKPLGAESIAKLAPEYVLTTDFALRNFSSQDEILNSPLLKLTPAAEGDNLIVMDQLLLLGYTPRVVIAADQLAHELHTE